MSKICRTFAPKIGKIMKMYKEPKTEILSVNTQRMMQDIDVSINGGGGGGTAGMPRRGEVID